MRAAHAQYTALKPKYQGLIKVTLRKSPEPTESPPDLLPNSQNVKLFMRHKKRRFRVFFCKLLSINDVALNV
jgi:hypothetical protein